MKTFQGRTAVITGAASGFGLEAARIAAREGMKVVMADVQQDALEKAVAEVRELGAQVVGFRLDVSNAAEVEALAETTTAAFGVPHFVFNNAGVGAGGLIWENTAKDWDWVVGVNLMGVAHGVRVFTPLMLAAAQADPAYEGHIVNTASMSGLQNAPNMGVSTRPSMRWSRSARRCTTTSRSSPIRSRARCCARSSSRPPSTRASATARPGCVTKRPNRRAASSSPRR